LRRFRVLVSYKPGEIALLSREWCDFYSEIANFVYTGGYKLKLPLSGRRGLSCFYEKLYPNHPATGRIDYPLPRCRSRQRVSNNPGDCLCDKRRSHQRGSRRHQRGSKRAETPHPAGMAVRESTLGFPWLQSFDS